MHTQLSTIAPDSFSPLEHSNNITHSTPLCTSITSILFLTILHQIFSKLCCKTSSISKFSFYLISGTYGVTAIGQRTVHRKDTQQKKARTAGTSVLTNPMRGGFNFFSHTPFAHSLHHSLSFLWYLTRWLHQSHHSPITTLSLLTSHHQPFPLTRPHLFLFLISYHHPTTTPSLTSSLTTSLPSLIRWMTSLLPSKEEMRHSQLLLDWKLCARTAA